MRDTGGVVKKLKAGVSRWGGFRKIRKTEEGDREVKGL